MLKILGISMIFRGAGVVSGRVWGWGVIQIQKKSFNRLLIHISNGDA